MRFLAFLTMIVVSTVALARTLPVSRPVFDGVSYSTIDEAAEAALSVAIPLSKDYEHGGVIYKLNDRYYYTIAVTQKRVEGVDYKVLVPNASTVVASYHTHPSFYSQSVVELSPSDEKLARKLGLVMYVGGTIRITMQAVAKFDPTNGQYIQWNMEPKVVDVL
jgi:hypothetical protein